MDGSRFDALTKLLVTSRSRRSLIGGLVAGGLTWIAGRTADARACVEIGKRCGAHIDCCSGQCGTGEPKGRFRCGAPSTTTTTTAAPTTTASPTTTTSTTAAPGTTTTTTTPS